MRCLSKPRIYFYDDLNQLIREDNRAAKRTIVWDYDNAGNIIRKRIWNIKFIDATPENDYSELGTPSYDYSYTKNPTRFSK